MITTILGGVAGVDVSDASKLKQGVKAARRRATGECFIRVDNAPKGLK
jgi:hypothetical protein